MINVVDINCVAIITKFIMNRAVINCTVGVKADRVVFTATMTDDISIIITNVDYNILKLHINKKFPWGTETVHGTFYMPATQSIDIDTTEAEQLLFNKICKMKTKLPTIVENYNPDFMDYVEYAWERVSDKKGFKLRQNYLIKCSNNVKRSNESISTEIKNNIVDYVTANLYEPM